MTLEEKIKHLRTKAMEEARGEGNAIIKQHEDALRQLAKQHEEEVKRQVETRIKAEQVSAKQQLNMAMSKAQLELKREISATQFELKKELFQEVEEKLNDYMQTPQYQALLVTYIEEMTIYLNPSDARWKDYLEEHTGMKLTISKEDFIGGVRAVIHERNILVDYAFKGALENESQKFSFKGGAGID